MTIATENRMSSLRLEFLHGMLKSNHGREIVRELRHERDITSDLIGALEDCGEAADYTGSEYNIRDIVNQALGLAEPEKHARPQSLSAFCSHDAQKTIWRTGHKLILCTDCGKLLSAD